MDGLEEANQDHKSSFDSKEVFASFFSQENPFGDIGIHDNAEFQSRSKESNKSSLPNKPPPLDTDFDLFCSLEDLYTRAEKQIKVTRKRKGLDDFLQESKVLVVKLNPSMKTGMKIVFTGEGDEIHGDSAPPGNINIIIHEEQHKHFKRQGNDLIYTAKITLLEALTDCTVRVPTIRGKMKVLRFPHVINCTYEQRLHHEGMPICDRPSLKHYGDLILRFDIIFPIVLQDHVKDELVRLLL